MDLQDIFNEEEEDISEFSDDGSTPDFNSIVDCLEQLTPHSQISPVERAMAVDEDEVELQISQEFPPPRSSISARGAFTPRLQSPQTLPPPLPQPMRYM